MKKEFEITMTFTVKADRSVTVDEVAEYADQLAEDIRKNDDLQIREDISISEVTVHNVEDNTFDDDRMISDDDDEM